MTRSVMERMRLQRGMTIRRKDSPFSSCKAQLTLQSSDKLRSVGFIRRKNPRHILQGLQQGTQQVEGDRHEVQTFWE